MSARTQPTNVSLSLQGQPFVGEKAKSITVTSNSHAVEVDADYGIWDTTSNINVVPELTNFINPA